jgi:uncharacterized membrane protein YgcG
MKTPSLTCAALFLCMTGGLTAATDGTNTATPAAPTPTLAPMPAPVAPPPGESPVPKPVTAPVPAAPPLAAVPPADAVAPIAPTALAVASPANATGTPSFASFRILISRNIFNPNRTGPAGIEQNFIRGPLARVTTFSFRGAAFKVGKGYDGFFSGDGAPESETLNTNDMINGLKITDLKVDQATLVDTVSTNHEVYHLEPTEGLTRQNGGPWATAYVSTIYSAVAAAAAAAPSAPDPGVVQFTYQQPVAMDDNSGQDGTDLGGGLGRVRRGRGGRGGRGGGFGGNGFGGNGFGGGGADVTPAAPPVTVDAAAAAAAEARLRARRAQEN